MDESLLREGLERLEREHLETGYRDQLYFISSKTCTISYFKFLKLNIYIKIKRCTCFYLGSCSNAVAIACLFMNCVLVVYIFIAAT